MESRINFLEFGSTLEKLRRKTPGMDRISYVMLRMLPYDSKLRIINLYNAIFDNYIPQQFKNSVVVPILKPGKDKTIITSYRPISLKSPYDFKETLAVSG